MRVKTKKILTTVTTGIAGCLLIAQFITIQRTNPPLKGDLAAPPQIKSLLREACYDCHSNETKLLWFDKPAPAYWRLVKDVKEGRKHLNFSEIGKLPPPQQQGILFEAISQIELGAMPLPAYERLHPGTAITPEQLAILKQYVKPAMPPRAATIAEISAADAQYDKWIQSANVTPSVAQAPNGIAFLPEYKNWKTISSTARFDNHTLRQILGNDIAVKAIAENHINPWPDGTAFAKVAWLQQTDEKGFGRPVAFFQVEFMIRDSRKYAGTLGWGWARWRGADLKPYGTDKDFTSECVGCHNPLANTNYVFTMPIGGQQ